MRRDCDTSTIQDNHNRGSSNTRRSHDRERDSHGVFFVRLRDTLRPDRGVPPHATSADASGSHDHPLTSPAHGHDPPQVEPSHDGGDSPPARSQTSGLSASLPTATLVLDGNDANHHHEIIHPWGFVWAEARILPALDYANARSLHHNTVTTDIPDDDHRCPSPELTTSDERRRNEVHHALDSIPSLSASRRSVLASPPLPYVCGVSIDEESDPRHYPPPVTMVQCPMRSPTAAHYDQGRYRMVGPSHFNSHPHHPGSRSISPRTGRTTTRSAPSPHAGGDTVWYTSPVGSLIGMALLVASVCTTLALELAATILYAVASVFAYLGKNALDGLPATTPLFLLCHGMSSLLLMVDALVCVLVSVLVTEVLAGAAGLVCTLMGGMTTGQAWHQYLRKINHLVRWACRTSLAQTLSWTYPTRHVDALLLGCCIPSVDLVPRFPPEHDDDDYDDDDNAAAVGGHERYANEPDMGREEDAECRPPSRYIVIHDGSQSRARRPPPRPVVDHLPSLRESSPYSLVVAPSMATPGGSIPPPPVPQVVTAAVTATMISTTRTQPQSILYSHHDDDDDDENVENGFDHSVLSDPSAYKGMP